MSSEVLVPPTNPQTPLPLPAVRTEPPEELPPNVSLSNFSTTNFPVGTRPYLSSPRSIEVCLLAGVTIDDLVPKGMDYYMKKVKEENYGGNVVATKFEDIARLRMERGEISRRKLIRKLKGDWDRKIMMESLGKKVSTSKKNKSRGGSSGEEEKKEGKSAEEVLMEREAKYLEKIQLKTEKELKQLLVYEMKRAAKEAEQREREERQLRKDEKRREDKEMERRRKMEKSFKIGEAIKRKKEEEEEITRRRMARQFEENIRLAQEMARKKEEERKEAIELARERARKTKEKREATEAIFKKQREDVLARDALARKRDLVRLKKVQENNRIRAEEYRRRRDKAKNRIEDAQRTAEEILVMKRLKFEEKEEAAKLRREIMDEEEAIKREERRLELERENEKRRETKAKLDRENEERAMEIKRKEDEINTRLTARGLLKGPADRMKKEDEEKKNEILAELQSTKDIEARRIMRHLKEEEVRTNMMRKLAGDEYKRAKIMEKMKADEDKLLQIKEERAKIKLKKEIAANDALIEKHRVQELAKKALSNEKMKDLLKSGGSIEEATEMINDLLGWGGKEEGKKKKKVKKIVKGSKEEPTPSNKKKTKRGKTPKTAPGGLEGGSLMFPQISTATPGLGATDNPKRFEAPSDPYYEVEEIRKRQNLELLRILKEEQIKEEEREGKLKEMLDGGVQEAAVQEMRERFARERNEASNRMLRYTRQHEEVLALALKTAREQVQARTITC